MTDMYSMPAGALYFITTTIFIVSVSQYQKKKRTASVSEIWLYPIKSCQGFKVSQALVGRRGFALDRIFMVVDGANKFVSQRTQPTLALVVITVDEIANTLNLSAPGMLDSLTIDIDAERMPSKESIVCDVWGDVTKANVVAKGGPWFSEFFGASAEDFRLVRITEDCVRPTDPEYAPEGQAAFSDGFAFLLASKESLSFINRRLKSPVTMKNFRPNIVVDASSPFVEDTWDLIQFESKQPIEMNGVKPCTRCKMPSIDPNTGLFDSNNEPTRTIKKFRSGAALGFKNEAWKGEVFFGQNLDHKGQEGAIISVGDCIKVKSFQRF